MRRSEAPRKKFERVFSGSNPELKCCDGSAKFAALHEAFVRGGTDARTHLTDAYQTVRSHRAEKRGGEREKLAFDEALVSSEERTVDLIALDEALQDLETFDPRQSRIVELRFFGGLTNEEIGEVLAISSRTIKREWRLAKAWLRREIMSERRCACRCRLSSGRV